MLSRSAAATPETGASRVAERSAAVIFYKVLWLALVAYPLWSKGTLAGSPAEDTTVQFLWVILPIVAVPWGYVLATYLYTPKRLGVFVQAIGPVRE